MSANIFTLKQQERIAAAIRGFYDLHSMDKHPREHAKDAVNQQFALLVAEAGDLDAISKTVATHGNYTQWLVEFIDGIGADPEGLRDT